jgi:alpha-glucosidase (family GH31 glycosyl hydrolase)
MKPLHRLDSRPVADPRAVVRGDRYRITVLTDGLVRLEHAEDGVFEDRASTFAVDREQPVPDFTVHDHGDHLEIVTARFRLSYDTGPFTTSGLSLAVGGGVTSYHSVWRYGSAGGDLGGTARTLDTADGAIPLEPGIVARNGYGVIDDSRSFLFDDDGWVAPRTGNRQDLYVFAYGHDYAQALQAFYAVSGRTPVLPRWALGNWWSRYYAYTADEYVRLMTRFQDEGIPFSVSVLDMDWHVVDVDPAHGSGWTGYSWNRELFPEPGALLSWLHEHGLRVTLNVHPADGVRSYEDAYPAMAAALGRDASTGEPISFDVTDREFLAAYFEVLHRGLEAEGVDFWWLDWQSGPHSRVAGIDPLWMLNHFHFLDSARDGRRGLTFSRYAGPGSHRYPVGFSGDTVISWASLAFQPHFTATASNIGYGWWSHDIGGHFFGTKDDELATRWLQLGTFSPVLRLHSGSNEFTTKEPWTFGPEPARVMTEFLRLRHRLVPYLHTMNHRAAAGTPLVLPLYYRWPEREQAYQVPNEFLFGSELVVAAITEPADRRTLLGRVAAWLPAGAWVDLLTDLVYDGDREVHLHRDLASIPVLAPAGAIVPLDGAQVPANDPVNPGHLEVVVVVGADGSFTLVEDDGTRDGTVSRTEIRFEQASGSVTVVPPAGNLDHLPTVRTWTLTFPALAGDVEPTATVDGGAVAVQVRREATRGRVTVPIVPVGAELRVELGPMPRLAANDVRARLFTLLDRAQIEYALKSRILDVATGDQPLALRAARMLDLELEPALAGAVAEVLLAQAGVR